MEECVIITSVRACVMAQYAKALAAELDKQDKIPNVHLVGADQLL